MKPARIVISSSLLFLALGFMLPCAFAQVYKCVDASGKITYNNTGGSTKGCKQLSGEQSVSTISMRPNITPASFPKISDDTQRERDKGRRQVLENELESERAGLEEARKEFTEQESVSQGGEAFIRPNGSRGVNPQKKLDRLQPYKDAVERRERNIEAITQELSGLR